MAISVDPPQTPAKFKEDQKFNFTLQSGFNKKVSEKYCCLYETFVMNRKVVSKRSLFVIGKDGRLQYAEVLEHAGRGFGAIEKYLAAFN